MACDANTILADGIAFQDLSGRDLKAVQLQLAANWLLALSPSAVVSVGSILERAMTSGIYSASEEQLKQSILQSMCNLT